MPHRDTVRRFLFDHTDLRGEITTLSSSYQEVLDNNKLPVTIEVLLGEFLAAVTLLSGILKFEGKLTLQARGDGDLPLIMAECSHHKQLRAIARPKEGKSFDDNSSLQQMLGSNATLAITIDPDQGERYQGIVPLEGVSLAQCLEAYFRQSEQLSTRFWLAADSRKATGFMLQALPQQVEASQDDNRQSWETVTTLADTVTEQELLQLEHEPLLFRLFHEEELRVFEPQNVIFACSCSAERAANALISLGKEEVTQLVQEQGQISSHCQFCNQTYAFGPDDLAELFGGEHRTLH